MELRQVGSLTRFLDFATRGERCKEGINATTLVTLYTPLLSQSTPPNPPLRPPVMSEYQRIKARAQAMQREKEEQLKRELEAKARREKEAEKAEAEVRRFRNMAPRWSLR